MKGAVIKDLIQKEGYTISRMAEILGTYQQKLDYELKKDDVRSSLIEEVASALNLPISKFYGEYYNITGGNNAIGNDSTNTINASDDRLIALLMSKDEQLTKAMEQTTKAMEQTSKAQEHMDIVLNVIKGNHNA